MFNAYINLKSNISRIGLTDEKSAYPFSGMGYIAYETGDFLNGALLFHKAFTIIQEFKGVLDEDTAICINNYACCLNRINRRNDAYEHL